MRRWREYWRHLGVKRAIRAFIGVSILSALLLPVWYVATDRPTSLPPAPHNPNLADLASEVSGPPSKALIQKLILELDDPRSLTPVADMLVAIGPAAVEPVYQTLQTVTNVNIEVQLIRILGGLGTNAASSAPEILARVADSNTDIRLAVAIALGKIRTQPNESIPNLQKLLLDEAVPVRVQAAIALGEFGPAAAETTLQLLEATGDPDPGVRLAVFNTLLRFNDPRAAEIAVRQLVDDPDPTNRAAAEAAALNHATHPRKD